MVIGLITRIAAVLGDAAHDVAAAVGCFFILAHCYLLGFLLVERSVESWMVVVMLGQDFILCLRDRVELRAWSGKSVWRYENW